MHASCSFHLNQIVFSAKQLLLGYGCGCFMGSLYASVNSCFQQHLKNTLRRAWDVVLASEAMHIVCTVALRNAVPGHGHVVEVLEDQGSVTMAFSSPRAGLQWMLTTQLELMLHDW